ncbi:hypothetical protein [Mycobacterium sp.]|uniref:hypothetical protein n=1 Tax=Mycobacterium sp. TaxID=1785 RepID=UPI003A888479
MEEPFIGSEAVAVGAASHSQLRRRYRRLFPDVYVGKVPDATPEDLAKAAWLWSRRRGIVAGFSACALLGSKWVDSTQPVELLYGNRNHPAGLHVHGDRLEDDEVQIIAGILVTTPARTALDLACWYPTLTAVPAIDAVAGACEVKMHEVETLAQRCRGRRGIRRARTSLDLVDPGAQSPKESWLRVILVRAGFPRPQTQIPVCDEFGEVFAYLDMGWDDVKLAVEYDGEQHRTDRRQYRWDVRRKEMVERQGWVLVRVVAGDEPAEIVRRVRSAWSRRT